MSQATQDFDSASQATGDAVIGVPASGAYGAGGEGGGSPVDLHLTIATWVAFIVLFVLLYKFAFKKIVAALDDREKSIQQSLDDADRLKKELAEIDGKRQAILNEAEDKAKAMIADARKAAQEAAHVIEEKAREEAQIQTENARREIAIARDTARAALRKEAADLAIGVASKIVGENLDDSRNRVLTDQLISQMQDS